MAESFHLRLAVQARALSVFPESYNMIEKFAIKPTWCLFKGRIIDGKTIDKDEVLTPLCLTPISAKVSIFAWVDEKGAVRLGHSNNGFLHVHAKLSNPPNAHREPFRWLRSLEDDETTAQFEALVRYYLQIRGLIYPNLPIDRTAFEKNFQGACLEVLERKTKEDQEKALRPAEPPSLIVKLPIRSSTTLASAPTPSSAMPLHSTCTSIPPIPPSPIPPHPTLTNAAPQPPITPKLRLRVPEPADTAPRKRPRTLEQSFTMLQSDIGSHMEEIETRTKQQGESDLNLMKTRAEAAEKARDKLQTELAAMIEKHELAIAGVKGKAKAGVAEAEGKVKAAEESVRVAEERAKKAEEKAKTVEENVKLAEERAMKAEEAAKKAEQDAVRSKVDCEERMNKAEGDVKKLKAQLEEVQRIQRLLKGALGE